MEWRNVPRADGVSPSQAFFGRRQRTTLPVLDLSNFNDTFQHASDARADVQQASKDRYDATAHILPDLAPGDIVRVQDPTSKTWNSTGEIVSVHPYGRSYNVSIDQNAPVRRNRRFLKPV